MNESNSSTPLDQEVPNARPFQLAQLAAILLSNRFHDEVSSWSVDPSNSTYDPQFFGALKRADWLLRQTENPDQDIHAYQVFQEGETYSAESIADEFSQIKWAGLKSKSPVLKLLEDIEADMVELPERQKGRDGSSRDSTTDSAMEAIKSALDNLKQNEAVKAAFPTFPEHARKFVRGLRRRPIGIEATDFMIEDDCYSQFLRWCFTSDQRGKKYRPHEIFRFAAMQEWSSQQLIRSASDLSHNFVPYPPSAWSRAPSRFSTGR